MFEDLVRKAQGTTKAPRGSFAILPQNQFHIARVMDGKGQLTARKITSLLGFPKSKVAGLINVMCSRSIIEKNKTTNRSQSPYLYNLAVESFTLKGADHEGA